MTPEQALIAALSQRDAATARAILANHPEAAYAVGEGGESALLLALYLGLPDIAEAIATWRAADLFEAAALGRTEGIPRLVTALQLASPPWSYATSADGWTALHLAAFFGHGSVVALLLREGAWVEAVSRNAMANTPLCAALAGNGPAAVVPVLLSAGANASARAANGVTPLHLAASRGAGEMVRLLLAHGANPESRMHDGSTPADVARSRGFPEASALLPDGG